MKKKTQQDDPLLELQQIWQQHKVQVQSLPFLSDEELRELFNGVGEAQPEPLPTPVGKAVRRAERYMRVRPFRYAVVICAVLLLANTAVALAPVPPTLTRSVDVAVSSQYATDTIVDILDRNNAIA